MKILKIFGIVVGIHVFALILIFANPGCSSSTRPAPAPIETVGSSEVRPTLSVPNTSPQLSLPLTSTSDGSTPSISSAPIRFNPDAPAVAYDSSAGVRYTPTRPGSPAASVLQPEPVAGVTPVVTYTVKSGDSLWTIAKKHHVTVAKISAANNLKNAILKDGQKLIIPSATPTAPTATAATPAISTARGASRPSAAKGADGMRHVVRSGESLSTIAQKYGVKSADIAVANHISDPQKIEAGRELIIPGWQTGSSKNGKAKSTATANANKAPAPSPSPNPAPFPTEPQTIFTTPNQNGGSTIRPDAGFDVPVIRVEETPPPRNP